MSRDISEVPAGAQHPLGMDAHISWCHFKPRKLNFFLKWASAGHLRLDFILRKSRAVVALPLTLKGINQEQKFLTWQFMRIYSSASMQQVEQKQQYYKLLPIDSLLLSTQLQNTCGLFASKACLCFNTPWQGWWISRRCTQDNQRNKERLEQAYTHLPTSSPRI